MTAQLPQNMRKKPKQARSEKTLDAIIEAASQLLAKGGEAMLTTNRVAERAGVSVGSIYQYFADKDAILLALIKREREDIGGRIAGELEGAGRENGEEIARRVIHTLVEAFRARRGRRRLVTLAMLRLSQEGFGADMLNRVSALIVAAAKAQPETARPISPVCAYVLTRAVVGAIRAAMLENSDILDDPEFEDELVRLAVGFLKG